MALERITFQLSDFAGNPGLELRPRVVFTPSGAAVGGQKLFFGRPVIVDTFQPNGAGEVYLEGTHALWLVTGNDVWYDVSIDRYVGMYTTSFGAQAVAEYAPWDFPGWQLKVPVGGGDLAALVTAPTNPAQMWIGPGKNPASDDDEPVQKLQPSTYTAWYRTNTVPGRGLRSLFEWE